MLPDDARADDIRPGEVRPVAPRAHAAHPTWWKAPLLASVAGLPFLVLVHRSFWSEDGVDAFKAAFYVSAGLLALSWALPHRRSLRTPRLLAAGAGLGCVGLLMLFTLLVSAAMAGI
ncbi:hypothetical protein [Streptomyces sp. NPDC014006]|uniref:hypothetical protein n=1 Tax=Streptomyces sp. NPDC014006 TaxID=3364870 RepID=UPI0037004AF4